MKEKELYQLKFPIGPYTVPEVISADHIKTWTKVLAEFSKNYT